MSHQFNEKYPHCHLSDPEKIGDGKCHGDSYNNKACGWDGGDCVGKLMRFHLDSKEVETRFLKFSS